MDKTTIPDRTRQPLIAMLVCTTAAGFGIGLSGGAVPWLPVWVGGVLSLAGLFSTLFVVSRPGVLRAIYLVLFAAAFGIAAVAGHLLDRT